MNLQLTEAALACSDRTSASAECYLGALAERPIRAGLGFEVSSTLSTLVDWLAIVDASYGLAWLDDWSRAVALGTSSSQAFDLDADVVLTDSYPMGGLSRRMERLYRHERPRRPPEKTPREVARSPRGTSSTLAELRRLSGLTWDQLAVLFGVSRRSVHFWASGKALASAHEQKLHRLLAFMRKIDRGTASENRAAILGTFEDGTIPFDLLREGEYDRAIELLGARPGRRPRELAPLSRQARAARTPPPPDQLVGAAQESVHVDTGRLLSSKPIRPARGK